MADGKTSPQAEPKQPHPTKDEPADDIKKVDTQAQEDAAKEREETGGYE